MSPRVDQQTPGYFSKARKSTSNNPLHVDYVVIATVFSVFENPSLESHATIMFSLKQLVQGRISDALGMSLSTQIGRGLYPTSSCLLNINLNGP